MKHSRKIALVLLGSVSMLTLTACDEKPKDGDPIYESAEQCRLLGGTQCDERWYRAVTDHVNTAPKYTSQESCLQQGHQNCTPVNVGASGAGNIWLPAMVGFMAGRMMNDTRPVYLQGYSNPQNEREREDRRVMAGGSMPLMVGNYWDGGGTTNSSSSNTRTTYPRGNLSQGMSAGAARAGWNTTPPRNGGGAAVSQAATVAQSMPASVSRGAAASTSSATRGGFGGSGAGMGSSGA